ncbi:MAG: UDP-N-acetylmuramoyl-L-alanyl-D-glutamate--2,6-diaminopimelate ligase [Propionibacteriaceae bacterium]|nr:UDP-N-acetylmuramoyl-L-alanyl-D-glutamate--2,6-diaminopimelate ligase [Propionibacteriaceae bacterium]
MSATPPSIRPEHAGPVLLSALVAGGPDIAVTGVTHDSRTVRPGDLYVALPGASTHGARFAGQAAAAGAVAVLTDPDGAASAADAGVPVVTVADPRGQLARIAATVYGQPAGRMTMFGVTGTTGKTSTTFLLAAALTAAGRRVGTIGTIGFRLGDEVLASARTTVTTPEAPDLQALLAYLAERGADAIAMEVSSHALALHRTDGVVFDVAGFTNLGRDHLDFHPSVEDYFQAKAGLFRDGHCRAAAIGIDDEHGRRLAAELARGELPVVTTGAAPDADYRVDRIEPTGSGGSRLALTTPSGTREFTIGLLGDFNARNAATTVAMLDLAGVDLDAALPGLAVAAIPGRMQVVDLGPDAPRAVVDFAHTPESVAAALAGLPAGRRIAVLGCGGDRDLAKREPMGAAAATNADVVVVTDDNPRSERPGDIRAAVLAGARRAAARSGATVLDGGDRAAAIRIALDLAGPDDWVAVLGKGHETGQQLADRTIPFDDVIELARAWDRLKEA